MLSLGKITDLVWPNNPQAPQPVSWNCLGTAFTTIRRPVMMVWGGLCPTGGMHSSLNLHNCPLGGGWLSCCFMMVKGILCPSPG